LLSATIKIWNGKIENKKRDSVDSIGSGIDRGNHHTHRHRLHGGRTGQWQQDRLFPPHGKRQRHKSRICLQ
jgi:hypothetical protein